LRMRYSYHTRTRFSIIPQLSRSIVIEWCGDAVGSRAHPRLKLLARRKKTVIATPRTAFRREISRTSEA
jgi:hypothetical protein